VSSKKGKNYSFINLMKKNRRINENFMNVLSTLTLEEVIALKLETSVKSINNKLYNFPLWACMPNITRDALLRYAMSACQSKRDMARFLGIPINKFNDIIRKYKTEQLYNNDL
jgi:phosphoribosylaminoimidazole carboxylase (NCAIR synthetase)